MEAARLPRLGEKEELVLRIIGESSSTGVDVVEGSDGRVGSGTVYSALSKLEVEGWVKKEGRWYSLTRKARRLLLALDEAARIFHEGEVETGR